MKPPSTSGGGSDHFDDETRLPALGWVRRARAEGELLGAIDRQLSRRRRNRMTAFAGVLAVALLTGVLWREWAPPSAQALTTSVSLPERRPLPDGSAAELKPGAEITFEYGPESRRIWLRRGEAHFRVVADKRPFIVQAGRVQVRAVGTEFTVQLEEQQVEVLVTEGRVQVARETPEQLPLAAPVATANRTTAQEAPPVLAAGQRAVIRDAEAQIESISEVKMAEYLAWRVPQLEFSRTPLSEVVMLMNRYGEGRSGYRFEIAGAELNQVTLSGFLRADNIEGLVRLLEANFGVAAERGEKTIILRKVRRPGGGS